jgi:hypothetical protein
LPRHLRSTRARRAGAARIDRAGDGGGRIADRACSAPRAARF